ncbi:MAG: glutamyl-tRNA reductase [Chitinispirillaceae bacterium]|nr:glutamyl-tRNA reductase [Chitinispirillaceae bacterium]
MMLHVGALGTDFRSASLRMRDALYLEKDRVKQFLDSIPDGAPLQEVVALSTCNRIEIFYVCSDHAVASAWLRNHLAAFHHIPDGHIDKVMKEYHCAEAVRHLFRVVSGMESMVFGEHEILGQVREAYFLCMKNASTDSYLNRLFQQAIATGKKVRSSTGAGRGALSIASIAVERMLELAGSLDEKSILIVGTGTMGIRALKRLHGESVGELTLCNRTKERAIKFAQRFKTHHIAFEELIRSIPRFDIVLLATANSGKPVIAAADLKRARGDTAKPLLIVDVGAPRNAEKAVETLAGVRLVCVDDLKETAERRLSERKNELDAINEIVEEQVREFTRWYRYKHSPLCGTEE